MMKRMLSMAMITLAAIAALQVFGQNSSPGAPVIPQAEGYVSIPGAAIRPDKKRTYRAIFDATHPAKAPTDLVPALDNAGGELNAFGVEGVPLRSVKFVIVFHGASVNGILNDANYKAKFGVSNPNLKVLSEMKKAGVEIFVCGHSCSRKRLIPKQSRRR
jgi:intracellular sulfur oxidation DsrE/DsrF family protein